MAGENSAVSAMYVGSVNIITESTNLVVLWSHLCEVVVEEILGILRVAIRATVRRTIAGIRTFS